MRKLLLALLLAALGPIASVAQTASVTGNIKTFTNANPASAKFRLQLKGCQGNIPRVIPGHIMATETQDTSPATDGSFTISSVDRNDYIDCGGVTTGTYYRFSVLSGNQEKWGCDYRVVSASVDANSVTCITVTPVVAAPTGDSTYLRLDGGNMIAGNFVPATNGTLALGSTGARWDGWFDTLTATSLVGPVTGNVTGDLTGNVTGTINRTGRLDAATYAGADICAKIAAAITALPATGGTVDARGLQGAQTCAANPLTGVTASKPVAVILPAGTIVVSAKWEPSGRVALSCGAASSLRAKNQTTLQPCVLQKAAAMATELLYFQSANNADGSSVEGITFNGNKAAGATGDNIHVDAQHVALRNVVSVNSANDGIVWGRGDGGAVAANHAEFGIVEGVNSWYNTRNGIYIKGDQVTLKQMPNILHVSDSSFNSNGGDGAVVDDSTGVLFDNADGEGNTGIGLHVKGNAARFRSVGGDFNESNVGGNCVIESGTYTNGNGGEMLGTDCSNIAPFVTNNSTNGPWFILHHGQVLSSGAVTVGSTAAATGNAQVNINGAAANIRMLAFRTGGLARWAEFVDATAESGANAGSDFVLRTYADDGTTVLNAPIQINRATSLVTLTATSMSTLTVGGGTTITKHLSATAALDFPNTVAPACNDLTIAVTGAVLGDTVAIGIPNASVPTGGFFTGWVSATDTVKIRFCAIITADPASGTFRADVWKH